MPVSLGLLSRAAARPAPRLAAALACSRTPSYAPPPSCAPLSCSARLALVWLLLLSAALALAGCPAPGEGSGWVVGSLWVRNCDDGEELRQADDFDLGADFFFGDPLFDTTDSLEERRSSLFVRIQETASNIEEANSLVIQFHDLVQAAQAFVEGDALPISDESLCRTCTTIRTAVRMSLNLFVRCPSNLAPITGAAFPLVQRATDDPARREECLLPAATAPPPCPRLGAAEKRALQHICEQADFNRREYRDEIRELLGSSGACLYLCEFGRAERGGDPTELRGFEIDYGHSVAGFFSADVLDTRAVRLGECAGAYGHIEGMFSFELVRSRVAQPFP